MRLRPGVSALGIVTLALGIGASTASFSAVRAVLLAPLPVAEQESVVVMWHENPQRGFAHVPLRVEAAELLARGMSAVDGVAGFQTVGARPEIVEGPGDAFPINAVKTFGDFFGVLGVTAAAGRLLDAEDDRSGSEPVAVVSHGYWMRATGAGPTIVGSALRFGGRAYTVVGVTPPGFDFPRGTEVWSTYRGSQPDFVPGESITELDVVARLSAGVTPAEAAAQMTEVLVEDGRFAFYGDSHPIAVRLAEHIVGPFEAVLAAGMAVAIVLLLVAVANAALLFLSGSARSTREIAVRRALGAGPLQVISPLAADAALVAAFAAAGGVGLAWLIVEALFPLAPADLPRLDAVVLDGASVAFAASMAVVAMVGAGGSAGLWFARGNPRDALADVGRGGGAGGEVLRRIIAGAQIAFAVVAAVGAGLLLRTVDNLAGLDRGFEVEGLYLVGLSHGHVIFDVPDSYIREIEDVSASVSSAAGISAASPTLNQPLDFNAGIEISPMLEGQGVEDVRGTPYVSLDAVLPSYFAVMGLDAREGRVLGPGDDADAARVVVLSESAAAGLWPAASALGGRVAIYPGRPDVYATVVGVVDDNRYRSFPEPRPAAWVPLAQYTSIPPSRLLVRSDGTGAMVRDVVSGALAEHAPGVRVLAVDAVEDIMSGPLLLPRFAAAVLLAFAVVTLLLAGCGVYGVFTVLVQERRAELGVRKALGARSQHLIRFVAGRVLIVSAAGLVAGVGASLALTGWIEALLYGVEAGDPRTVSVVVVTTLALAMLAGAMPALRATRADPATVLRAD